MFGKRTRSVKRKRAKLHSALQSYAVYSQIKDPNYLKLFKKNDNVSQIFSELPHGFCISQEEKLSVKRDISNVLRKKKHLTDNPPLIKIEIAGLGYMALLDSGATYSVVNKPIIERLRRMHYHPVESDKSFITAGGVKRSDGIINVPIKFDGLNKDKNFKFYVLNDAPIVLLGRDFLNRFNIRFSVITGDAHWTAFGKEKEFLNPKANVSDEASYVLDHIRTTVNKIDKKKLFDLSKCARHHVGPLENLLRKHASVFNAIPGLTNAYEFRIDFVPGYKCVKQRPYHSNPMKRAVEDRLLDEQIENDWIETSGSEHCVPTVLIPKPGVGNFRMCQDYKATNAITIKDCYPLPTIESIMTTVGEACFFTVFDLAKGYYQIPVCPEDRWKTAFVNHRGLAVQGSFIWFSQCTSCISMSYG